MNWLINIFQDSSDKARLITTLIAAIIAIAVVLINQWFHSRRARKETLILKIEEIFSLTIKMHQLILTIHDQVLGNNDFSREETVNLQSNHVELESVATSLSMLASLYFSNLSHDISMIRTEYDSLHKLYINAETIHDYEEPSGKHISSIRHRFLELNGKINETMNKSMH